VPASFPRLWVACGKSSCVCDFLARLRQSACARCLRVNSGHRSSAARRGQRQARPGCRACHKRQVRVRSCRGRNAVPCPSKHEKREHFTYPIVSAPPSSVPQCASICCALAQSFASTVHENTKSCRPRAKRCRRRQIWRCIISSGAGTRQ